MKQDKIIFVHGKLIFSILCSTLFLIILSIIMWEQLEINSFENYETIKKVPIKIEEYQEEKRKVPEQETINLPEYINLPRSWKGYEVIGKIEIPKLSLEKYILSQTNNETLKVAVTKVVGPKVNEIGNFCIAGHNYTQTFGKLKELAKGDIIFLTDTYDRRKMYQIYDITKVSPTDLSCLSQETNGEREVTLITCTLGAIKRQIVKAIEVYD